MRRFVPGIALLLCVSLLDARQEKQTCGTHNEKFREEFHLHHQSKIEAPAISRKLSGIRTARESIVNSRTVRADIGNLAILDDMDGVVARRNPFNLNGKTLRFLPIPSSVPIKYRYEVTDGSYDPALAESGTLLDKLGDDDAHETALPFEFPFWGVRHRSIFVNSDGNLTFGSGDVAITDRSLGRLTSGQPRIAALFRDLDPTKARNGVTISSSADRFAVSWINVPEFQDFGTGLLQTFQIRLYPDGRIELAFSDIRTQDAVTGITPGKLQGATSVVSFVSPSGEYASTIAERYAGAEDIDIFAAAQKFYLNHDDAYDYLVIYNTLGISAGDSTVAFETTVRNDRSGYGDPQVDVGIETGSKRRLQALINMGPLTQYPKDPNGRVPARLSSGDTPLTVLAHEVGHLFLAFASTRDTSDPEARPLLGFQTAHWNFRFNSEASLLEGNRIRDNGAGTAPRFLTVAAVEGFSALDQYLMGLRPPSEVPDTFLVTNARGANTSGAPRVGVAFDGERLDVGVGDIIAAEGRRTPDHTVSQRRFRIGFIVVTASGGEPSPEDLAQVESYRTEFENYFNKATSNNAYADTSLKRSVQVSFFPAAGVAQGSTVTATVSTEKPVSTPLTLLLRSAGVSIEAPRSVVIPAGAATAQFTVRGLRIGADDLVFEPDSPEFETVHTRIQVSATEGLRLAIASGNFQTATPGQPLAQPVQVRVSDINNLPYPGVQVDVTLTGGGSVDRVRASTDDKGIASFVWTPGSGSVNELRSVISGGGLVIATALSRPAFASTSVVNAASFAPGLVAGGIATIFGSNLAGASNPQVLLNGVAANVLFSNPSQVNFVVPVDLTGASVNLEVRTSAGASGAAQVNLLPVQPGVFFDAASGFGAILVSGTSFVTQQRPVSAGEVIEIYATGLGSVRANSSGLSETATPVRVTIGGRDAEVLFSGLAPGFAGLYQINARTPSGISSGAQPLRISSGSSASNEVKIQIR